MDIETSSANSFDWVVDTSGSFIVRDGGGAADVFSVSASTGDLTITGPIVDSTGGNLNFRNIDNAGTSSLVAFSVSGSQKAYLNWFGRGFFNDSSSAGVVLPVLPQVAHPNSPPSGTVWIAQVSSSFHIAVRIGTTTYTTAAFT